MLLMIIFIISVVVVVIIVISEIFWVTIKSPTQPPLSAQPAPSPPGSPPADISPTPTQGDDYGQYYKPCSGSTCDACLMPGWCHHHDQCKCLDNMVCVSAGDIACQVSGNVVTTHDQNVQNGSGSILHTACALIHDDLLWLPRCENDIPCPSKNWWCDSNTKFKDAAGAEVMLCRPKNIG